MLRAPEPHLDDTAGDAAEAGPPGEILADHPAAHAVVLHPLEERAVVEIVVAHHVLRVRAGRPFERRVDLEQRQAIRLPGLVHDLEQGFLRRRQTCESRCGDNDCGEGSRN